jgi:hypothetical protein
MAWSAWTRRSVAFSACLPAVDRPLDREGRQATSHGPSEHVRDEHFDEVPREAEGGTRAKASWNEW